MRRWNQIVVARNGHTLVVGIVARISGCAKQKEMSLEDQVDNAKDAIGELFEGPVEYQIITTKAKGERLDRPELDVIEKAFRSRKFDFFVFDDLSRLIRGGEAARLLGVGVDHGTRSLCLEDGIDTIESTWEEDALNACAENVAHNERTSKRIKTKNMNRFRKFGYPTGLPVSGYKVPKGAKGYDDWKRDDDLTCHIVAGMKMLKETLNRETVADFFNEIKFPLGPHARRKNWNGPKVREYFRNSLLKGMPQRGKKHTVKRHDTGRRVSVTNPDGPVHYHAPHLAHLSEEEFDELNDMLDAKNERHRRDLVDGVDPLQNRSRRHSVFPGMHSRCWYCGYNHVWGANGINGNLMCNNSRAWQCWHSIGYSGWLAVERLVAAICDQLPRLNQFDDQFAAMVEMAAREAEFQVNGDWNRLLAAEKKLRREKENLIAAVKELGPRTVLVTELDQLEANEKALLLRRHDLELRRQSGLRLPESPSVLREMLAEELRRLSHDSAEFGALMCKLVPSISVYAVRLCDGGHLYPRAKVTLDLAGTYPDLNLVPGCGDLLTREIALDLFDPPQRERIREESVRLAAEGIKPTAISRMIAERPTSTAVGNALKLQQKMLSLGLADPYVTLLNPPDDYPKLRRHKHARYVFTPLSGYERPTL